MVAAVEEQWGFLLAEDLGVKNRFTGFKVRGREGSEIKVRTFFRWPEKEGMPLSHAEAAELYPFITIDLIDLRRSEERESRGLVTYESLGYKIHDYPVTWMSDSEPPPEPWDVGILWSRPKYRTLQQWNGTEWIPRSLQIDLPIPYDFYYQVTTHTHMIAHDRELWSKLMQYAVRDRYGYIETDTTVRRADVLDMSPADGRDANGKRVFRKALTLRVSSELPESVEPFVLGRRIEEVRGVVRDMRDSEVREEWVTTAEDIDH